MRILRLSQKSENRGEILGFAISFLLHSSVLFFFISGDFKATTAVAVNTTKISLNSFVVGGGKSDLAPSEESPKPVEKMEKVKEEVTKDKIVKKVADKKKKEKPKKPVPPVKEKPNKSQKESKKGGNNAINPSTNNIASSAVTSDNPIQTLTTAQKTNIGAQIQAILAREAKKNSPKSARFRNKEIFCKISFDYGPNGEVSNITIIESAGSKALDNVILKAIAKTKSSFPPITETSKFIVPVKFKMN